MTAASAGGGDDVDVLYVGGLAVGNESANDAYPAASNWFRRLPLPWYTEARGMDTASERDPADIGGDPPPVVVTTPDSREAVAARLPDYTARTESLYLRPEPRRISILGVERRLPGRAVVVFIGAGER
jgi:predicted membrane-bound mannosyltransferase